MTTTTNKSKKLIELGTLQTLVMDEILKEQYKYYPEEISKFRIIKEYLSNREFCWLAFDGKLNIELYGMLMYQLGIKIIEHER